MFDTIEKCPLCNAVFDIDEAVSRWMCDKCFVDSLNESNAILVGSKEYDEIRINHFLAFVYDDEDINIILERDFERLPVWYKKSLISDYAKLDPTEWADIVVTNEVSEDE